MGPCSFCDIVAGARHARTVYEDEHAVAFFPIAPAVEGHTLVVPKTHVIDLWDMDEVEVRRLIRAVMEVGEALRAVLEPEGLNIIHSAGRAASQTVFHAHVYVVPRWSGDSMGDIWPPRDEAFRDEAELTALARRISARLQ